jgi:AmmeMemoRadiSam system protein A
MNMTPEQGDQLLSLARLTIAAELGERSENEPQLLAPVFSQPAATFVTLKIDGQLRGCIGNLSPVGSLAKSIRENALNAAFRDHRFSPLSRGELRQVHIDVSILSEPETMMYTDADDLLKKLRPGVDGVILSHGAAGATFLPQVWEQLPKPEEFLGHLCRKAGLSPFCWRDLHPEIRIYHVQCFAEGSRK